MSIHSPSQGGTPIVRLHLLFGIVTLVTLGLSSPAVAFVENKCLSIKGTSIFQFGTASCTSEGKGSFAMAVGDNATATDKGEPNKAIVRGDGSIARLLNGEGNRAFVFGDGSGASVLSGNGNNAIVKGDGNEAPTCPWDNNTALTKGNRSQVYGGTNFLIGIPLP